MCRLQVDEPNNRQAVEDGETTEEEFSDKENEEEEEDRAMEDEVEDEEEGHYGAVETEKPTQAETKAKRGRPPTKQVATKRAKTDRATIPTGRTGRARK